VIRMDQTAIIVNVDDNEPARYARSRILKTAGFEVHEASTGRESLKVIATLRPDVVLLDVHLPDANGIEICRELKANPDNASLLVIQMSASALTAPHATASLNSGADMYLMEPIDPDVLIATVRALLRVRKAERELAKANSALQNANKRLEELNEELRRSNSDLQQFAFVASHDLQEPLRTVTTFVQLIENSIGERFSPEETMYFKHVLDGAERMRHLIDDVLTYSQAGRDPRDELGNLELETAVKHAIQNLGERIGEAGAQIVVNPLPVVHGNFTQLANLFQNLISNSLKYRRAGVPLSVEISATRSSPAEWTIQVRDNGIGISPQYHEQVFIPFKRLHGRDIPGTGIGLALCKRIVEMHDGRIWLDSEEAQGANFQLTLPAA
jgi:two-component system, sensor histidine kinase and response regulator